MKLMTQEIINKLPPLYSQDGKRPDTVPVVIKFFTPDAQATWFATEGERNQETGDWTFFGLVTLGPGFDAELGYFSLAELQSIRGKLGLSIERDRHFKATLADAMRSCGIEPSKE